MKASIVDLRYHMKDVLKALNRNEAVEVFYHGVLKGIIHPAQQRASDNKSVRLHPLCGFLKDETQDVEAVMADLRGGRYRDL